jgi:hypothetical protein
MTQLQEKALFFLTFTVFEYSIEREKSKVFSGSAFVVEAMMACPQ